MSIISDSVENWSEVQNYQRAKGLPKENCILEESFSDEYLLMRFGHLENIILESYVLGELVLHLGRHTQLFTTFILLRVSVVRETRNKLYFFQFWGSCISYFSFRYRMVLRSNVLIIDTHGT